jgi:hypothetical protein
MGLDVDAIILCQPDNGEMALEVVDQLVRSSAVDIIAVDSVAALVPRAEIEGEIGAVQGAAAAAFGLHSQSCGCSCACSCVTLHAQPQQCTLRLEAVGGPFRQLLLHAAGGHGCLQGTH